MAGAAALGAVACLWLASGAKSLALDDAYVHIATANNLVEHGVFGVRPDTFAPASSSPLWVLLLAPLLAVGASGLGASMALCGVVLVLLVTVCSSELELQHPLGHGLALVLLVFGMAMPTLWITGMESPLQALLAIGMVLAVRDNRSPLLLGLLAVALTLTRYEGVFLAGVLALWVRDRRSVWLLGGAALGPLSYGLVAVWNGWPFVPPGVLTRSALAELLAGSPGPLFSGFANNLYESAHLAGWLGLVLGWGSVTGRRLWSTAFIGTALLQLLFGRLDAFYRYDAWLIPLGFLALFDLAKHLPARTSWPLPLLLASLPVAARGGQALLTTPARIEATWGTTGSLAAVFQEAVPEDEVATSTMGHLAAAGQRITDLGCLGDQEVLQLCLNKEYRRSTLEPLLEDRGVSWILVPAAWADYDGLGNTPPSWSEVLRWEHPRETWVLYARRGQSTASVVQAAHRLAPPSVMVHDSQVLEVPLVQASTDVEAVHLDESGLAFYTNGAASFHASGPGELFMRAWGTPADGSGPILRLKLGSTVLDEMELTEDPAVYAFGRVPAGPFELVFTNDAVDDQGHDRNAFVGRLWIRKSKP